MADFEVLAPGGHQHLVGKIKEQLAMKADTAMADAVDKVARNQATREVEGELVSVEDAYGAPMLSLGVDGKSEQIQTTGKNLLSDRAEDWVSKTIPGGSTRNCLFIAVDDGESYHYHRNSYQKWNFSSAWCNDTDFADYTAITVLTNLADYTFTNSSNFNYLLIYAATLPSSDEMVASNLQVEVGSSFTSYEPYTGGKPSPNPDYPQPIESVEGLGLMFAERNLLQITTQGNNYYTVNSDGSITYAGDTAQHQIDIGTVKVYAGVTYHLSGCPAGGSANTYRMYPAGKPGGWYDTGNGATFTPTADETLTIRVYVTPTSSQQYAGLVFKPQLEVGSTATEFKKYSYTTVPLYDGTLRSLPGGTRDELNLTYLRPSTTAGWAWYSRELVQRVQQVTFDETEDWHGPYTSYASGAGYYTSTKLQNLGRKSMGYKRCNLASEGTNGSSGVNTFYFGGAREVDFVGVSTIAPTLADWLAIVAATPAVVLYELATPITTQLDPIELPILPAPNCTVWADPTTGLQMEYVRDTQLVIDSLNAEIDRAHAAIAPVEHGTSSANYAVGSYLMLDGTFCKVTSAIATGETIAIGTNVVATTVDAELASLA